MLEKKIQFLLAIIISAAAVIFTIFLLLAPGFHSFAVALSDAEERSGSYSVLSFLRESEGEDLSAIAASPLTQAMGTTVDFLKGHDLAMQLPSDTDTGAVTWESDYHTKTFTVKIPGIDDNYFSDYRMAGNSDGINDIRYEFYDGDGIIEIYFDEVREPAVSFSGRFLYLDYLKAHDIYDKVIVIDAGHGGRDPGAQKEGYSEKDIDLSILQKLKEIFDEEAESGKNGRLGIYYTRVEDVNTPLTDRVDLVKEVDADLFLSIHNNSTASGRLSTISGTQVLYRVSDQSGASKAFAERVLSGLLESLSSGSKGIVAGDDIYIIRESPCPVALAEIGFMTNREELANLVNDDYQRKTAKALHDAVMDFLSGKVEINPEE